MKNRKFLVSLVLVICFMGVTNVHAQQSKPPDISLESITLDTSTANLECLNIGLLVKGFNNHQLAISAVPFYKGDDKAQGIQNASGDPADTGKDGIIVKSIVLKIASDKDYWDKSHGGEVQICLDTEHFPITADGFSYYIALGFFDASDGTYLSGYDTSGDVGFLSYPGFTKKIRITNVQLQPVNLNLTLGKDINPGSSFTFTFEAVGYKGVNLRIAMYPVDSDGNYIPFTNPAQATKQQASDDRASYETTDGYVTSQILATPGFDDSIWIEGRNDTKPISLFVPYEIFPLGKYSWHPYFEVFVDGETNSLYDLNADTNDLTIDMQ